MPIRTKAARKLIEIANAAEAVQDGRIHIELINEPFLAAGGSPAEYGADLARAISAGWLCLCEVHARRSRSNAFMARNGSGSNTTCWPKKIRDNSAKAFCWEPLASESTN
jgi:hypothetical protein